MVWDLLGRDPSALSNKELDDLQAFVNRGKSVKVLKSTELATLREIILMHALEASEEEVADIFMLFIEEGNIPGGTMFKKLITRMVEKRMLRPEVIDALEKRDYISPPRLVEVNEDGVPVK
jgi:hypothetical protein